MYCSGFSMALLASTLLFSLCSATPMPSTPPDVEWIRERINIEGCNPNVCFALDGSASISAREFVLQKEFVKFVTNLIGLDRHAEFSGMQYGLQSELISGPTSSGIFQEMVNVMVSMRSRRTYIAPGIGGCSRMLRRSRGEANKIVILGDGRSNFDSDVEPFDPASMAQRFMRQGRLPDGTDTHSISAVAVHFDDITNMTNIVGEDNVFEVDDWDSVLDRAADLTKLVCGFSIS